MSPSTRRRKRTASLQGAQGGAGKLGRLNHVHEDSQTNVEQEQPGRRRSRRYEHVYVEMDEGDALVFDGNLLHRSDANRSDTYRWGYICSYNAVENAPFKKVREYGELRGVAQGAGGLVPHSVLIGGGGAGVPGAGSVRPRLRGGRPKG